MDWSKTKSIFIIVFLILNIFLLSQIAIHSPGSGFSITNEEIEKVKEFLSNLGVEVDTEIPENVEYKNFLDVRGESVNQSDIQQQFFSEEDDVQISNYSEQYIEFLSETGRVIKKENGRIVYEALGFRPTAGASFTEREAIKASEEFHKQGLNLPEDARLTSVKEINRNRYRIEYHQVFRRQRVDTSYITMIVGPSGVESYEKYWVEPIDYSGGEYLVIPSTGALIRLMDYIDVSEAVVNDITLSYYSAPISAGQWQVAPVWAIKLENIGTVFLNAYTGELEGIRKY
ncbi:two-component system regulatory protein YycI [Proteinivorax tanatarense]|uniref:Two-component system regulatory protein YycI n=1 Tax=Proteinivorax tanatarense TaxID=1260629 RepID=A0AAU7VLN7_9FIRM